MSKYVDSELFRYLEQLVDMRVYHAVGEYLAQEMDEMFHAMSKKVEKLVETKISKLLGEGNYFAQKRERVNRAKNASSRRDRARSDSKDVRRDSDLFNNTQGRRSARIKAADARAGSRPRHN